MASSTNEPKAGEPAPTVLTDPAPPTASTPVMMTDAYIEIGTANLSCLGIEISIEPENKPIELTTFCGVKDYPGPTKWHFKAKLVQDVRDRRDRRHVVRRAYGVRDRRDALPVQGSPVQVEAGRRDESVVRGNGDSPALHAVRRRRRRRVRSRYRLDTRRAADKSHSLGRNDGRSRYGRRRRIERACPRRKTPHDGHVRPVVRRDERGRRAPPLNPSRNAPARRFR